MSKSTSPRRLPRSGAAQGLPGLLGCILAFAIACRHEVPVPADTNVDIGPPHADGGGEIDPTRLDAGPAVDAIRTPDAVAVADAVLADVPTPATDVATPEPVVDALEAVDVAVDRGSPTPPPDPSCGAPGQPCCAGDSCHDNGCCAAGDDAIARCVASGMVCRTVGGDPAGMCANGTCAGCGTALNQPCCQGNVCSGAGLACNGDRCEACGGPNQRCCPNRTCAGDSCCVREGNDDVCLTAGDSCPMQGPGNAGTCMAGHCSGCGGTNQPCCNGDLCYQAGQACVAGRCGACGGLGQAACPGNACTGGCLNGDAVCIAVGGDCGQNSGTCTAGGACNRGGESCGGLDEPCCGISMPPAGAFCSKPGTTCTAPGQGQGQGRHCVECGGLGQPCCDQEECHAGTCRPGGGFGGVRTCR
jgi:hypothetical protein